MHMQINTKMYGISLDGGAPGKRSPHCGSGSVSTMTIDGKMGGAGRAEITACICDMRRKGFAFCIYVCCEALVPSSTRYSSGSIAPSGLAELLDSIKSRLVLPPLRP